MLKLVLDWASDSSPEMRMAEVGWEDDGVRVELVTEEGPGGGWPEYAVYVPGQGGEAGPVLWSWLVHVYGCDEDDASELASLAEVV